MTHRDGPLKVHFSDPRNGWMKVRVEADETVIEFDASQEPCDWLQKLIKALTLALHGIERAVKIETERGDVEVRFAPDVPSGRITVSVTQASAAGLSLGEPLRSTCEEFLRSFRDLQDRSRVTDFRNDWKWRFPSEAVDRFSSLVVRLQ